MCFLRIVYLSNNTIFHMFIITAFISCSKEKTNVDDSVWTKPEWKIGEVNNCVIICKALQADFVLKIHAASANGGL